MTKSSIELAVAVLEAAKAEGRIPKDLQERIGALGGVRSDVKGALAAKPEKRELPPEQVDRLVGTLKSRFGSADMKLRKAFDFADVEKSLRANPEALFSIQKLEETGGEPQVVGIDSDGFVFEDRSAESPSGRRNKSFDEADEQRKEFGPNVRFQSSDSYEAMQKTGKFDLNSWSWLETDAKTREAGDAMRGIRRDGVVYVKESDAVSRREDRGWRAALRVKKA